MDDCVENEMSPLYGVREGELNAASPGSTVYNTTCDQHSELLEYITPSSLEIDENSDTKIRSALYNILSVSNLQLFKVKLQKWQCNNCYNPGILFKVNTILPKVYEELKLKNVLLTKELEFFVEDKLISSYFSTERNGCREKEVSITSLDNINDRIEMTVNMVNKLRSGYVSEEKQLDPDFFLVAKFVSQNIHILKRQLRSTYNKLPWEEMEFCLVNFIYVNTKCLEFNVTYKLILNRERLLNHLANFASNLSKEKLTEADVNSKFPQQLYKELSARNSAMKSVIARCAVFQELYDDFEQIKNVYSLKRIESYVKLALSVDLSKKEELGKLVIERTLQVIGESLKSTLESPNVSDDIHKRLLTSAPRNLRENITLLRDSLSHAHTLRKKIEFEGSTDLQVFYEVQNDIKKIETELGIILYKTNIDVVAIFLKRVIDCKNVVDVKYLTNCLTVAELGEIELQNVNIQELEYIKKWVNELLTMIKPHPTGEKNVCHEIEKVVHSQQTRLTDMKSCYFTELSKLDDLNPQFLESNDLETIQIRARSRLNKMNSMLAPQMFGNILNLLDDLKQSCDLSAQYSLDEMRQISDLVYQIRSAVLFGAGRIKGIDRFKESLEKKVTDPLSKAKEKIKHIFSDIYKNLETEDRSAVQQELGIKQQYYEAKLELCELFTKLMEGSVTKDSCLTDRYYDLTKLVETKKLGLDEKFQKCEWGVCKRLVNNNRSSYQTLLKSVKNAIDHDKLDTSNAFKEFFKSFKNNDLMNKLNAAVEKISQDNKNQHEIYFENRVEMLARLLPANIGNNFKILDKYMQDRALQAAVEMLVLDLMEVMNEKSLLADNGLFFDGYSPVLTGKTLRNYLAHGDALIDILPFDPAVAIVSNALKLIEERRQLVGTGSTMRNVVIGQQIENDLDALKVRYTQCSDIVSNQNKMFIRATQGNVDKIRECILKGADVKARDTKGWTGLCFATRGNSLESFKFFLNKNLNIDTNDINGQSLLHIAVTFRSTNIIRYLEESGLNINEVDRRTLTPLHYGSENGCRDIVDTLLKWGANVNVFNDEKVTPLHFAAARGHATIVAVLLDNGADVQAMADGKLTPLHAAAMNGHKDVVLLLLARMATKVDISSRRNATPLHYAACNGHTAVVEALLDKKANANSLTGDRLTPLHLAAYGGRGHVVDLLLATGVEVNVTTKQYDWTPLHYAASAGHADIVSSLLSHGATVEARSDISCTPLHLASRGGHLDVVRTLTSDGGASVNAAGPANWTPLHFAAMTGAVDVAEVLLQRGASVDPPCEGGRTPLHLASLVGHGDIAGRLLTAGADLYSRDGCGMTPLHYLAAYGHTGALEAVTVYALEINVRDNSAATPLHLAAGRGHSAVVRTLLERGADINAKARGNWTPLHHAVGNGHLEVVALLLGCKASVHVVTDLGITPLHLAGGCDHMVDLLCAYDANVGAVNVHGWTPLHFAANGGHVGVARALLRRWANVAAVDCDQMTPLHLAAQCDHVDVVGVLVMGKTEINVCCATGETPLHLAACHGHASTIDALLRRGAEVNTTRKSAWTALHLAAQGGHTEATLALLVGGADPNPRDNREATPLHAAALAGHSGTVEALLGGGAAPDAPNESGWTPLHYSAVWGRGGVTLSLLNGGAGVNVGDRKNRTPLHLAVVRDHVEVVATLLGGHATVDSCDRNGNTPLHYAAEYGRVHSVHALLDGGAQVDARNKAGETPLYLAAVNAQKDTVEALLDRGADVLARNDCNTVLHGAVGANDTGIICLIMRRIVERINCDCQAKYLHYDARDKGGDTPLVCAVMAGNVRVVTLLLECGVDVNVRNNDDLTALDVATKMGNSELVQMLVERKATTPRGETPRDETEEEVCSEVDPIFMPYYRVRWDWLKSCWQLFCYTVRRKRH